MAAAAQRDARRRIQTLQDVGGRARVDRGSSATSGLRQHFSSSGEESLGHNCRRRRQRMMQRDTSDEARCSKRPATLLAGGISFV